MGGAWGVSLDLSVSLSWQCRDCARPFADPETRRVHRPGDDAPGDAAHRAGVYCLAEVPCEGCGSRRCVAWMTLDGSALPEG